MQFLFIFLCYIHIATSKLFVTYECYFRFGAPSELQMKAFYEAIVRMIAEDLQPLSIVENEGFKNMIKLLDSR